MKPAPFTYARAGTVDEAVALLAGSGDGTRLLAGGQSLLPLLAARRARPGHLVDIDGITTHRHLRRGGGGLRLGALVRHAELERAAWLTGPWRVLREAASRIGSYPVRVRGTLGGSLAHADPGAELPLAVSVLDGQLVIRSATGSRSCAADGFFLGPFRSALEHGEMLVEVRLPPPPAGLRSAFEQFRVHRALASAAVAVALDEDGRRASHVRIALGGAGPTPLRARDAEQALTGAELTDRAVAGAARLCAGAATPAEDVLAGAAQRRELIEVLVESALTRVREAA